MVQSEVRMPLRAPLSFVDGGELGVGFQRGFGGGSSMDGKGGFGLS